MTYQQMQTAKSKTIDSILLSIESEIKKTYRFGRDSITSLVGDNYQKYLVGVDGADYYKTLNLYRWTLLNYAQEGDTIFDSHVESGSIRIACHDFGLDFEGCEIDGDYWQAQEDRYREHILQPTLFSPVFPTYEQCDIFES